MRTESRDARVVAVASVVLGVIRSRGEVRERSSWNAENSAAVGLLNVVRCEGGRFDRGRRRLRELWFDYPRCVVAREVLSGGGRRSIRSNPSRPKSSSLVRSPISNTLATPPDADVDKSRAPRDSGDRASARAAASLRSRLDEFALLANARLDLCRTRRIPHEVNDDVPTVEGGRPGERRRVDRRDPTRRSARRLARGDPGQGQQTVKGRTETRGGRRVSPHARPHLAVVPCRV